MDTHRTLELVLIASLVVSWIAWLYVVLVAPFAQVAEPVSSPPVTPSPRAADVPSPASAPAARSTVTLRLMCQNERDQHAHVQIPATSRRPTFAHGGQLYVASRQHNGDWIYRWTRQD